MRCLEFQIGAAATFIWRVERDESIVAIQMSGTTGTAGLVTRDPAATATNWKTPTVGGGVALTDEGTVVAVSSQFGIQLTPRIPIFKGETLMVSSSAIAASRLQLYLD